VLTGAGAETAESIREAVLARVMEMDERELRELKRFCGTMKPGK
jgi:hypothetical protein